MEITMLVDDLDGSTVDVHTLRFSLDGTEYAIDLGPQNEAALRKLIAGYAEHARLDTPRRNARRAAPRVRPVVNTDTALIRAWAKEKGYDVNDRGRVPGSIIREYRETRG